jgi:acyl-homoserine-lactone acylase
MSAALLVACSGNHGFNDDPKAIHVEIKRTSFGVPHIVGKNLRSAAYGLAYSYAQDNICIVADRFMTVAGERSKYLGGDAANLRSDFYYKNILDQATVDKAFAASGTVTTDAVAGYVAGYNRFLADGSAINTVI